MRHVDLRWPAVCLGLLLASTLGSTALGTEVVLKDGRLLHGKLGKAASLAENLQTMRSDSPLAIKLIALLDDNLRRTYFSERLALEVREERNRQLDEKFSMRQRVQRDGREIKIVGQPLEVQPFDEFGRRTFTMAGPRGPVHVVQGITELTPQWTRIQGLTHVWDMRVATSSIPHDVLHKILLKQIDPKNVEDHKKIARFYLQSERYEEARKTLEDMLTAFPDQTDLKKDLEPSLRAITQLSAKRLASELRLRRDAGQHRLVFDLLKRFPAEGVGGEILQGVREMIEEYKTRDARCRDVGKHLESLAAKIPNTIQRENLKPILDEIAAEIGPNTLDRMAAFLQNADDAQMTDAEKVSLAISGWLLGGNAATEKLPTAIAAYKVRRLVREYLNGKTAAERNKAFDYIKTASGVGPQMIADLLANMQPPIAAPKPVPDKPGFYEIETQGLTEESKVTYYLQLPPEYDPYRHYPAIVTLHGEASTPNNQIDWWAGELGKNGQRAGQASRHGYIVIAPAWTEEHQRKYGYTAREHAAVLNSLRDACRRFAIDTDRVFLTGHSMGGDAAWDIGLAHPDLWAGVIPIVAQADRYCALYWENAQYVPFYVIAGELDGGSLFHNARDLDRYLRRGFDTTVVEYLGRGHEDFHDEILRLFEWMGRFRRNFFPREFTCETMRPWDNYFWWVEGQGMPARTVVDPANWPPPNGTLPLQIKASINKNNISVRIGTSQVTIWLSPKMIDFKQRSTITVNGRRLNGSNSVIRPDLRVLLEDVRTRGDRQHPFWARVDAQIGRKAVGDER